MRFTCIAICIAAAVSLAAAEDPDPNAISFHSSISMPTPGLAVEPWDFMGRYRAEKQYLFDIPDFRDRTWFKVLLYFYGAYAAYDSRNDKEEFKLKYPLRSEPSLGMYYETEGGQVVRVMSRGKPMVAISLDKRKPFDEIVVFQFRDGVFFVGYYRRF